MAGSQGAWRGDKPGGQGQATQILVRSGRSTPRKPLEECEQGVTFPDVCLCGEARTEVMAQARSLGGG